METNKIVLMLMGASGSGKSYLEKGLLTDNRIKKAVSVTTRDKRVGELDGVDYTFIDDSTFDSMVDMKELIQTTEFAGQRYGSARSEYTTPHDIVTLAVVPSSAVTFKAKLAEEYPNIRVLLVYFDISETLMRSNMRSRGDSEETINKRLIHDDLKDQMIATGITPDFVVTDELLTTDLPQFVLTWLTSQKEFTNG